VSDRDWQLEQAFSFSTFLVTAIPLLLGTFTLSDADADCVLIL